VLADPPGDGRSRLRFTARPDFTPAHPAGVLYAVLDGARDLELAFKAKLAGADPVSLFFGDQAGSLATVAPYAFAVPAGAAYFAAWQAALGNSAGILLDCPAGGERLLDHLREVFVVKDSTGQEFFFRYYDPRVLRAYLPTCTPDELRTFFGPIRGIIVEKESADGYHEYGCGPAGLVREDLGLLELVPAV
jgi:hypothetical protein